MRGILAATLVMMAGAAAAQDVPPPADGSVRFATFNAALNANAPGEVLARLETGEDAQARMVAEVIQRVRPDVLVLQELDRDSAARALSVFNEAYLAVAQGEGGAVDYPFTLFPLSNTGVPSGVDLNGDGEARGPNDAKGFGQHPGQYGFAVLSRLPLTAPRTFSAFLWRDMPGSLVPEDYYSEEALAVLPLSSKTHLMVGVEAPFGIVSLMAAHPTPPVFDDPQIDWNGRRNADEIRLLADLLDAGASSYAVDDFGRRGGLEPGAMAIIAGDLNADPTGGASRDGAIEQLLDHPAITDPQPSSEAHGTDTADFSGGLRVDYVLPTTALSVTASGVFWPAEGTPLARLNAASDHHLVWVDVAPAR